MPTITTLAVIAVAIILAFGLWTMAKGSNPNLSQKLMRLRVGVQALAILLIMLTLYFSTK